MSKNMRNLVGTYTFAQDGEFVCTDCHYNKTLPGVASEQPVPEGKGEPIIDMVVADLQERAKVGAVKYGEKLKAFNGRDALLDAYQEALDLCMYLRQAIDEKNNVCK